MEKPVKYIYQIRSRNGSIVSNLQIYGKTEADARKKLLQMYPHCEVIETGVAPKTPIHNVSTYEDVLDMITKI